MITIGIPFYNPGEYFKDAISSILHQDFSDFELLLINDGSTDDSLNIAKQFKDSRIKILSDGLNLGLSERLNQITNIAKFDLIARMDADDISHPQRISKQIESLIKNNNDLSFTGMASISKENRFLGFRPPRINKPSILNLILGRHGINHATMVAKKSWLSRNPYNTSFKRSQDFELWIRTLSNDDLNASFLDEPLYFYRESLNINFKSIKQSYTNCIKAISLNSSNIPFSYLITGVFWYLLKILFVFFITQLRLNKYMIRIRNRDLSIDKKSGQNYINNAIKNLSE